MPRQLARLLGLVLLVAPAVLFAVAVADDAAAAADSSDQYSIGVQLPDGDTIRINFPPDADAMEVATEVGQSHGLSEEDVRRLAANLLATRPRLTVQYPGAATPFSYFKGRDPEISALRYAQAQKIPLVEGTQQIAALVRQNLEPAELEGLSPPKDLKFMLPVSSVISGTQDDRSVPFWSTSVPKAFASNLCGQLVPENLGDACYERVIQLIQENLDVQPASEEPVPVAVHILTVDGQNIEFPFFEGDTTATVASRFTAANSLPDSVTSQIDAALQAAVAKAAAAETSPDSSAESTAAVGAASSLTVQARVNVKLSEGLVQIVRVAAGEDMKSAADFAAAMMKQPPQLAEQLAAALANNAADTGPSSHDVVETMQLDIGDTRVSLPIYEGDSACIPVALCV